MSRFQAGVTESHVFREILMNIYLYTMYPSVTKKKYHVSNMKTLVFFFVAACLNL